MGLNDGDTESLLSLACAGDAAAVQELLARHRDRLCRMVAVRIDPRVAPRIDPSDVVQEALMDATRKLPDYAQERGCAFYPWLRRIAWERLVKLHRRHLDAQCRSVKREARWEMALPDESSVLLAERLAESATSVAGRLVRQELVQRVQEAIGHLAPRDREVIVLRNLEQLTFGETAGVLGITEAAARSRYGRAVERLHDVLSADSEETP